MGERGDFEPGSDRGKLKELPDEIDHRPDQQEGGDVAAWFPVGAEDE
jgi:hypothetical protein